MAVGKALSKSDWKDGFLFLGNDLLLDFLNTRPLQKGEPLELLQDFTALLRWFGAADLLSLAEIRKLQARWAQTEPAQRTVAAMQKLRERLRTDVVAWEQGGAIRGATIDELNRLLAEHPMRVRLTRRGARHPTEWFESREPEDLFAPLAHGAANLFASADRRRVRKCDHCVLHFLDTSKKGTRRWCSMKLCGNRLKVAAYAGRRRAEK